MTTEKDLYIQRLEQEIARNHAEWRKNQESIIYWQQQCEVYKSQIGKILETIEEVNNLINA